MSGIVFLVIRFAIALALFAFLAWALWTLWLDLRVHSLWVASRQVPSIYLSWMDTQGSHTLELDAPEGIIGRDSSAELRLDDETVSSKHARLSYHHAQWWIEDLNSRNGTFLNGQAVKEPVVVTSGDELRCGRVVTTIYIRQGIRKDFMEVE